MQKTFCTDFLTKKMKKNEGELPQYHVRNSHPPIVSAEVFEWVQMEIESRRQFGTGQRCSTPHVKEEAVKGGFVQVMSRLLASKQELPGGCGQILNEVLTTDEQSGQIARLQDQAVGLAQRIRGW